MQNRVAFWGLCVAVAAVAFGCAEPDCENGVCPNAAFGVDPQYKVTKEPLEAYCSIDVEGHGTVDMESDYLPHVILCENGGSNAQGLRAQAVAARTYAYKYMQGSSKPIKDSQAHQVYTCAKTDKTDEGETYYQQYTNCQEAVVDTSQQVLMYKNKLIAAMFVAGASGDYLDDTCRYKGGSSASTQKYVTYNEGKSGDDISIQSSLGSVSAGNDANRGCMSQYGATCLGAKGVNYIDILKFFYADDIAVTTADGACTKAKVCETVLDKSGVVIDDKDPCFKKSATSSWYSINGGYDNHLYYTYVWDKEAQNIGTWNINVTRPGLYEIFAYIEKNIGAMSENAPYVVRASGVEKQVNINLALNSGWVSIGKFNFAAGGDQWVKLSDASGEKYTNKEGKRIVFDAIKFVDAVGCSDACVENAKQCVGNSAQQCIRNTATGCLEWSASTDCGSKTCVGGSCADSTVDCSNKQSSVYDECDTLGQRQCADNGFQICGYYDEDPCLEWSSAFSCNAGESCDAATAQCTNPNSGCSNECMLADSQCQGAGYVLCGNYDSDACLEWNTEVVACSAEEHCEKGRCVKNEEIGSNGTEVGDMPAKCLTEIDGRPSTIIDDQDGCFIRSNASIWSELIGFGHNGHLYYSYQSPDLPKSVGTWFLNVTKSGRYSIYAYVESGVGMVSSVAPYTIKAGDTSELFPIKVGDKKGWFHLGDYDLVEGAKQYVQLSNENFEVNPADNSKRLIYDAIQVVPYGQPVDGTVIEPENGGGNNGGSSAASKTSDSESDCHATPNVPSDNLGGLASVIALIGLLFGVRRNRRRKTYDF